MRRISSLLSRSGSAKSILNSPDLSKMTPNLFSKRQELIKPIQDKIFNAIQDLATEKRYGVIFDKSGELSMLFADPDLDKSDDILRMLGYK